MRDIFLKDENGNLIKLDKTPFSIGNLEPICDLIIASPDISALHCIIEEQNGDLIIKDMNTRLGLDVNGKHLEGGNYITLTPGDVITIDKAVYTLYTESNLLTEDELVEFNAVYEDIKNEEDQELKKKKASLLINNLFNKIKRINSLIQDSEGKEIPLSIAFQTYLSDIIEDEFPAASQVGTNIIENAKIQSETQDGSEPIEEALKIEDKSRIGSNATEENKTQEKEDRKSIEELKRELRGKNSFELRHRRRTIDQQENSQPSGSALNDRRVNVDINKLKTAKSPPARQTKPENRVIEHPVLKEQEKSITLRELTTPFSIIKVTKTPFKIGRSSNTNNYVLDRKGISRNHATIMRDDRNKNFILKDNNATNGTYLNDSRLINNEVILNVGDTVRFYEYEFKVVEIEN